MENKYLDAYRKQTLRKAQLKQLDILEEVAKICERNNIPYWIDAGTLLGAVRHGGFIPWDDDIDISMRESDMKRFVEIAPKELPSHLVLQSKQTDPTIRTIAYKVRDLNSFYVEGVDDNSAPYQKGLFIDIFPFVNYPSRLGGLTHWVSRGICIAYDVLNAPHYYSVKSCADMFFFGAKLLLCKALWKMMQPLAKKGEYMCSYPYYNWHGIIYRSDSIFPLSKIKFEGKEFSAPANPDAYLSSIYRNYMELPPVEKRAIHSIFIMPELVKDGEANGNQ